MSRIAVLLLTTAAAAAPAFAASLSIGTFAPGETIAPPAAASPEAASRTFVRSAVPVSGRVSFDLPATGTGPILVWVLPSRSAEGASLRAGGSAGGRALATRLVTPSGLALDPSGDGAPDDALRRFHIEDFGAEELGLPVGRAQEALRVRAAEPGLHRVEVEAPEGGVVTIAAAEPASPLVLTTWTAPLSRQPGEPVTVHARLADGDVPVAGASLSARLAPEGRAAGAPVPLFDDGLHGDGAAGDGHFAAVLADLGPLPAGHVAVRVEAEGSDSRGVAFARTGASGFVNERGAARLLPGSVRAAFAGEGEARVLRVTAEAAVREAGEFRLDVLAGGEALPDGSRPGLAWAERTDELAAGPGELAVEIPASLLGEGPVHVDVRLLGLSRPGVAGRVALDVSP